MSAPHAMQSGPAQSATAAVAWPPAPAATAWSSTPTDAAAADNTVKTPEGRLRAALAARSRDLANSREIHDPRQTPLRNIVAEDGIVTVRVGHPSTESTEFPIHRSILLRSSAFFQAKAKPEWSRGEAIVDLPDHTWLTFGIYRKWLYYGCIEVKIPPPYPEEAVCIAEWNILARAFVLGEELMDTEFKDTIMDALRAKGHGDGGDDFWEMASAVVHTIYDGTPSSSPARKFLVNLFLNHAVSAVLDSKGRRGFPADFIFDLAKTSIARRTKTPMKAPVAIFTAQCIYHDHGKDGKCYLDG